MKIKISEVIGPDLATRKGCDNLFDMIEKSQEKNFVIDFSGVISISRSFAHQYTKRKQLSSKTISEVEVSDMVRKMMDLVKQHSNTIQYKNIDKVINIKL
ncbi:MAG: hypothetical protein ACP5RS_02730 [Thermoplasmata archaeon]